MTTLKVTEHFPINIFQSLNISLVLLSFIPVSFGINPPLVLTHAFVFFCVGTVCIYSLEMFCLFCQIIQFSCVFLLGISK